MTYKSVYQYVVKSGIRSKTVHDLRHVYTSTSKHTIINTSAQPCYYDDDHMNQLGWLNCTE